MGNRAKHEGSVRQRRDGMWEVRVMLGGVRVSRYGKTRAEVIRKLRTLQSTPVVMSPQPSITLEEWVTHWLAERALRPSALATYRAVLRPIRADLGHVNLSKLNTMQLSLQFSLLHARGMGARRLQLAHGYLKSCLERAVEMDLIDTNPMSQVRRPKWTPATKQYWTLEETQRFLDTCTHSRLRYAPLFLLVATTGLRMSEVLALETGTPMLIVKSGEVWVQGYGYTPVGPKTPSSQRRLPVLEIAFVALKNIPFRTSSGKIPLPAVLRSTLTKLCIHAQVPPITPHGLRHVHAAITYAATGDMHAVQKRLGHANVTTTMGLYSFGLGSEETTRDALDALLSPTRPARDDSATTTLPPLPTQ
jgi:integrase